MPGLVSSSTAFDVLEHTPSLRGALQAVDWTAVAAELAPVPCATSGGALRRKSRDYFWFSPVLKVELDQVVGDLVATPRDEAELLRVARYCVEHGLPLTPRGGGTGNYGQAMPLHGGVVVELTALAGVRWLRDGILRAGAGTRLFDIEAQTRGQGFELRFHPSTWKTATIGGFVAGGSTGCGAVNYGTLSETGNVLGLRVLTLEEEPRFVELRGRDVEKAIHAYGLTGIITEVEMPLAPAIAWRDVAVSLPEFMDAARLADTVARAGGIISKLLTPLDWNAAKRLGPIRPLLMEGQALLCAMVAQMSFETFAMLVEEAGGRIVYQRGNEEPEGDVPPIYELAWNHTTLHALKTDASITYLQTRPLGSDYLDKVEEMHQLFGEEAPMHLEFARVNGDVCCFGMQLVRFTTAGRLDEIIQAHWDRGWMVFNPHTYVLEAGGRPTPDPVQFRFKQEVDPYGLLNPGKMPGWRAPEGGFFLRA